MLSRTDAFVTLPDGARLAYDLYDFTDPWEKAETIILVHGFSKHRAFYYGWLPGLARRFRVVRLDQRGHGGSSIPPRDFRMALEPFVADLLAFQDALGIARAHLVTAEYTSKIGLEFAIAHPQRLHSLILPGFALGGDGTTDTKPWAKICLEQGAEAWARLTSNQRVTPDSDPAMREWYVAEQGRMPSWFLAGLFASRTIDQTPRLPLNPVPTLILAGTGSRQVAPDAMRRAAEALPQGKLVEFSGMPFNVMTACPEQCVAAVLDFIDGLG